jgi:hypothetical protein
VAAESGDRQHTCAANSNDFYKLKQVKAEGQLPQRDNFRQRGISLSRFEFWSFVIGI